MDSHFELFRSLRMSNERWNDDIAYAFSTHRLCLRVFGVWPLQTQTLFAKTLWISWTIGLILVQPFIIIDFISSNQEVGSNIETILQGVSAIISLTKLLSIGFGQKRLGTNINAAADDWLSVKDDEKARKIMKKYTVRSRRLTFLLLYSALGCFSIYVTTILFVNLQQLFFTDPNLIDANATWIFLIPSGSLGNLVSGEQYAILLTIQILQTFAICSLQAIGDTVFFTVTMHLTGQLEVLKNKIRTFADEQDTEANYRKKFVDLVNRHSELMEYHQNLEDTFHFILLVQLVIITVLLALIGLRIDFLLTKGGDQVEMIKNTFVMNYLLLQSLVVTYAADFLQGESENIFLALYTTSWFKLPVKLMKDLNFAMMRSSIPFRLTGGKFFYVNRETMMNILKTAASYVSVLRIALQE